MDPPPWLWSRRSVRNAVSWPGDLVQRAFFAALLRLLQLERPTAAWASFARRLLGFRGGDLLARLRHALLVLERLAPALFGQFAQLLHARGDRLALALDRIALLHQRGQLDAALGQRAGPASSCPVRKLGQLRALAVEFLFRLAQGGLGLGDGGAQVLVAFVVGVFLRGEGAGFRATLPRPGAWPRPQ